MSSSSPAASTTWPITHHGARPDLRIVSDRGVPDLQLRTASSDWISVHDPIDPVAEARALVDLHLKGQPVPPIAVVIGIGLGHAIVELERRRPDVRIVAIELVPGLLEACRQHQPWNREDDRSRRLIAATPSDSLPIPAWPAAVVDHQPVVIVTPALARLFPDAFKDAKALLKQFLYEQRANVEARRRLAALYFNNTIENLPALCDGADVSALDGLAEGQALVLIGAGPSLDRQLQELKTAREQAWYVALDTALRPLMAAGIVPDLVVSIDPTPLNGRHLINLPSRARPWLVAEASLDPAAVNAFSGRTFFCKIGRADPWPWLEPLDLAPTKLKVWGSVLTASCDLFTRMRAARVVFAGLDLSYTKGQPYCRGTAFEEDWRNQQQRDGLPSLEAVWEARIKEVAVEDFDLQGRRVSTAPQMVAFRNWVRTIVASNPAVRFINATGRGILHGDGIEHRPLSSALSGIAGPGAIERKLQSASTKHFSGITPRLLQAVDAVVKASATRLWQEWDDAIPNFEVTGARRRLAHAAERLRAQQAVPATQPAREWIEVPFDAANFSAKGPMQFRVSEENVVTYAYQLRGKTMTLAFKIARAPLSGAPVKDLYLRLPEGYVPKRHTGNIVWMAGASGRELGYVAAQPGQRMLVLRRASEGYFPPAPQFFVFGQITFEVA